MKGREFFAGPDKERVLANYVRMMADAMGLKDWQFFIKPDPTTEYLVFTHVWGDAHTADLCFSEGFFTLGPRMQREVVCHELCHWHLHPLSTYARASFRTHVGGSASEQFGIGWQQHEELAIDAMSCAWAREFPIINWLSNDPVYFEYERENGDWDKPPHKGESN